MDYSYLEPRLRWGIARQLAEKFAVSSAITKNFMDNCEIEIIEEFIYGGAVKQLTVALTKTILAGRPVTKTRDVITVPESWRDHVLDRFIPARCKRIRRRIKYRTIETKLMMYNVCPHIAVHPASRDGRVHYAFLELPPEL